MWWLQYWPWERTERELALLQEVGRLQAEVDKLTLKLDVEELRSEQLGMLNEEFS